MSDYEVEIAGKYDLDQINLQISGEEAGASEFKSSKVSTHDNQVTNIVTFHELPAGILPKPLKLIKESDPQLPVTQKIWSGVMVVKGTKITVTAYRTK